MQIGFKAKLAFTKPIQKAGMSKTQIESVNFSIKPSIGADLNQVVPLCKAVRGVEDASMRTDVGPFNTTIDFLSVRFDAKLCGPRTIIHALSEVSFSLSFGFLEFFIIAIITIENDLTVL